MLSFEAVGAELQLGAIWETDEPQARVIAAARTRRKQDNGRP
jgi:hypothetical protein